ncbi:MAG: TIGR02391 family protein [Methylobacteriaceae bacterium]|nr:TIGR02391 family protein [Rhodoblastus sp.]MCC0006025.1 TIGR02391 family protein [Methylobacteriaceae bacterium]
MAKAQQTRLVSASLSPAQAKAGIAKVRRRLDELKQLDIRTLTNEQGEAVLAGFANKINVTLREIYGVATVEYDEYKISSFMPHFVFYVSGMDISVRGNLGEIKGKIERAIVQLTTIVEILTEQAGETSDDGNRALFAYERLELHPEIARAASQLYRDAHYANAVEAAVKSLNVLVRQRSGLEADGSTLMERAFNPANPIMKFNELQNQSDRDEQKGFMFMFAGAVAGLRNPRAHGFIKDDPERALEFIAFVSLLAKLLDGAKT